ncbi:Interleukin-1 receptor-like 1 [Acipenser ruthenus]|uniref:Interleukin-1 receptor-like 1 n=1 Tax=Acipenser ruthenus TaxID=7906 RepID=A0A444UI48_ACIRT|nr:Interleukin-1 receptor-like 1 [Acipenser ruthenus]
MEPRPAGQELDPQTKLGLRQLFISDFQILPNENRRQLVRNNITRKDDGIYTCQLTWTHKGKQLSVSRARRLIVQAPYVPVYPVIEYPRDNTEEALLAKDNRLFVASCFVVLIFSKISVAILVNYFKIDIVLLYRDTIKPYRDQNDKRYDAYVIYPKENLQESSQEKIRHFINQDLPNILERKYDYNLFICGRDDLPGEDTAVAIEKNIINSKRLIIILTPGTSFGMKSENAYDQQLGLYNALVHDEMKVILIEMENFSSYKDLPESLQHIIQKRKTLKWNGGQSPNSRFWKHLRYEMPSKRNPTYFTVQNVSTPTPEFGTYIE